jgi:HD-like signal output (HDOD) protein
MLAEKSLVDIIHERVSSQALQLPVFHHVALKLMNVLAKEEYSIAQVAQMIIEDQALSSHVLRLANSAFFGGLSKVTTIRDAIVRLGARQVTNVVTVVTQSQQYCTKDKTLAAYMLTLWKHSLGCALGTKWFAEKTGYKELAQEGLLAGLLHDIGQLFLFKVLEEVQASEPQMTLPTPVIVEVLQHLHVEQGTMLMQHWNIPELYGEIVRQHHAETYDTSNTLLLMVRLVDMACKKVGIGLQHDPSIVLATTAEAQALGVKEMVLAELEIILEDAMTLSN